MFNDLFNRDLLKTIDLEIDINKLRSGPIATKRVFHKSDLWTSGIKATFKNGDKSINLKDIDVTLLHKELMDHESDSVNTYKIDDESIVTLFPPLVKDEVGTNVFCFLLESGEQRLYTQSYIYEVID